MTNDNNLTPSQDGMEQPNADNNPVKDEANANPERQAAKEFSPDDFLKSLPRNEFREIVETLFTSQKIASIYIDARSGGAFFSGDTQIGGDVVGGGRVNRTIFEESVSGAIHTGSGSIYSGSGGDENGKSGSIRFGRVIQTDIRKIQRVYVQPYPYQQALQILQEKHLVILWGQMHWGKWTTAIHLLAGVQKMPIRELNPNVELAQLQGDTLPPDGSYILDTLQSEKAVGLAPFWLNQLSEQLCQSKSYLIITVDSRVTLNREQLSDYLTLWNELPSVTDLLSKHLPWYLDDVQLIEHATTLQKEQRVLQLLETTLRPRDVDHLATLIAQAARGDVALDDALARFTAQAYGLVENWFREHRALDERCFMIATAVLNGAKYQHVIDAQEALRNLLQPPSPKDAEESSGDTVFSQPRSSRIKEVLAHLVQGYEVTEFGRTPIEQMVLDNPSMQPAVLHYVWYEYDRLRPPLLAWLQRLGLHASFDVRTRAAAAVGELSKFDFAYIRKEVLLPWANAGTAGRASASVALGIPAWESEFAPQVLGLLHHWSTLPNNQNLRWTAAAAYGGLVGLRFPDAALRNLYIIAQALDPVLHLVAGSAIITLFNMGAQMPQFYSQVLTLMVEWTDVRGASFQQLTGLSVFLNLARECHVRVEPGDELWVTLLWLAQNDTFLGQISQLWQRALNDKRSRLIALDVLQGWLRQVDTYPHMYTTSEALFTQLYEEGSEREKARIVTYLGRWHTLAKQTIQSAGKILDKLNQAGGTNL